MSKSEWKEVTLGEVAEIVRKGCAPDKFHADDIALYSIPGFDRGEFPETLNKGSIKSSKSIINQDSVLVSLLNPRIPRVGIARGVSYCSTEFAVVQPKEHIDFDYLFYILSGKDFCFFNNSIARGTTGSRERSKREDILKYQFSLPPLDEQRQIVAVMQSIDQAISDQETHVKATEKVRENILHALLTEGGDDWKEVTLGEIVDIEIGRTPARKNKDYWTENLDLPFLSIKVMGTGEFEEGITQKAVTEKKAKMAPAGSLLMSFKLSIGRVIVASRDVFYNEAIAWLKPDEGKVNQGFLRYLMENVDWTNLGTVAIKGKTMNKASLKLVPLSLPSLDEQQRIVDVMQSIDSHLADARGQLESMRKLRGEVLNALLSGEHEIPADFDPTMRQLNIEEN